MKMNPHLWCALIDLAVKFFVLAGLSISRETERWNGMAGNEGTEAKAVSEEYWMKWETLSEMSIQGEG